MFNLDPDLTQETQCQIFIYVSAGVDEHLPMLRNPSEFYGFIPKTNGLFQLSSN